MKYTYINRFLAAILFIVLFVFSAMAQNQEVKGTVKNSRMFLQKIKVKVKGTSVKTFSGSDGEYQLQAPENAVLIFSRKGYHKQIIPIHKNDTINVQLIPDSLYLNKLIAKKVKEIEPYAHFLKIEKQVLKHSTKGYEKARFNYLKEVYFDHPKVQNPDKALEKFLNYCKTKDLLLDEESFKKAARILGFELITDASPMDMASYIAASKAYRNIPYTTDDNYSHKLDIFVPKKPVTNPTPCIVFMHDGGWSVHKRAWFEGQARYMASKGYVAVNIDYRMLNAVTPLECVYDAKAAVRWVRANAAKYNIDPNKIGASGASSGAALAAILATTAGNEELEGNGSNLKVSARIAAAVGFATPTLTGRNTWPIKNNDEIPSWFDKISPYKHLTTDDAPMMFIHGDSDKTVDIQEVKDMYAKYQSLGIKTKLVIIKGKRHVFYMNTDVVDSAFGFFKEVFEDDTEQ